MRGQANLVALAVALLALTAATGLAVTIADLAFASGERDAKERRIGHALADRLISSDSVLTDRANVLNASAVNSFNVRQLEQSYPVIGDADVRIRVGDREAVTRGDPSGGTTVRRVVLVQQRQTVTLTLGQESNATTLPRRTRLVDMNIDQPNGTTVKSVRANDRVVLHDPSGLQGEYTVRVSRFETVTLSFASDGPLVTSRLSLTYYPARTTKAVLTVTVDD